MSQADQCRFNQMESFLEDDDDDQPERQRLSTSREPLTEADRERRAREEFSD